jgi:hypothetical protein
MVLSFHIMSRFESHDVFYQFLFFLAESNIQEIYFEPSQAEFCWLATYFWSNSENTEKTFS